MEERKTLTLKTPPINEGKNIKVVVGKTNSVKTKEELQEEKKQPQLVKEREEKKAAFELLKKKKQEMLNRLIQDYPQCFSREVPKPLKQGIHLDLGEAFSKNQLKYLKGCLHTYTNSKKYHQAMVTQSHRIDLIGNPVEAITEEHREHAKQKLRLLEEKRKVTQANT